MMEEGKEEGEEEEEEGERGVKMMLRDGGACALTGFQMMSPFFEWSRCCTEGDTLQSVPVLLIVRATNIPRRREKEASFFLLFFLLAKKVEKCNILATIFISEILLSTTKKFEREKTKPSLALFHLSVFFSFFLLPWLMLRLTFL